MDFNVIQTAGKDKWRECELMPTKLYKQLIDQEILLRTCGQSPQVVFTIVDECFIIE
jgi:hypothetical protein